MWPLIFGAVNLLAVAGWVILVFLPRSPLPMSAVLYLGVGLLCLIYSVSLILLVSGVIGPVSPDGAAANFTTIEGVRALFASDAGVTIGWTHYLAFDLFTGLWIARDADAKQFSRITQAPVLIATLMAGPLGLFVWLVIRERRARLNRPFGS